MNDNNTLADDLSERIRALEAELAEIRADRTRWQNDCVAAQTRATALEAKLKAVEEWCDGACPLFDKPECGRSR